MIMAENLVTIMQYPDYMQAEMAKQLLADNGIEAVVTGENASNIYSVPAVEGPEIQVLESQVEKALEILQSEKEQQE
jgi:hypothetical protein